MRSPVTGPHLDVLRTRSEFFDACIASAVEYLRELWPDEHGRHPLRGRPGAGRRAGRRTVSTAGASASRSAAWCSTACRSSGSAHLHRDDEWHRRSFIESCVFRAVAELLGEDPWDIAPERYRHF